MHPDCAVRSRPLEDPYNSAESAFEKPARQVLDLPVDRLQEDVQRSLTYAACLLDRPGNRTRRLPFVKQQFWHSRAMVCDLCQHNSAALC